MLFRSLDDIATDLRRARAAVGGLPPAARPPVAVALGLFAELARRLQARPASALSTTRTRVPGPAKARVVAGVLGRQAVAWRPR